MHQQEGPEGHLAFSDDSAYTSAKDNLLHQCKPLLSKRNESSIKLFQYLWLVLQFALWKLTFLHQPAFVEISVGVIIWTQLPYISSKFQTLHTAYHLYIWHSAAFFCLMLGSIRHQDVLILLNMASICIFSDVACMARKDNRFRTVCLCCIAIAMHTCLFIVGLTFGTWPSHRSQAWYFGCIAALCADALLYVSCMPLTPRQSRRAVPSQQTAAGSRSAGTCSGNTAGS